VCYITLAAAVRYRGGTPVQATDELSQDRAGLLERCWP
jgi:hypothetical protein